MGKKSDAKTEVFFFEIGVSFEADALVSADKKFQQFLALIKKGLTIIYSTGIFSFWEFNATLSNVALFFESWRISVFASLLSFPYNRILVEFATTVFLCMHEPKTLNLMSKFKMKVWLLHGWSQVIELLKTLGNMKANFKIKKNWCFHAGLYTSHK